VKVLQPGDTLIFNDGTYTSLRLDPNIGTGIHGTATAPITIKAANDGKVIFDANGTSEPIFVTGSSYVTIEGFVARNSSDSVVYLYGNNTNTLGGDDYITLRRITAYGAADGNNHVFNIGFGPTNILVEDCAAWGRGRYKFIAYHAQNVTFRRDWAYWEGYTSFAAPRAGFAVYGASNVTLENVISTNVIPTQTDDNYYTSVYVTTDDGTNWPSNNTTVLGSLFYDNCEGFWENSSAGTNTQLKDDYFSIPSNPTCHLYSTRPYGDGLVWNYNSNAGIFTNCTFVNNTVGFNRFGGLGSSSLINTVFLSNGTAIVSDPGHNYADFSSNTTDGTTLVTTDKTVKPGYDTLTYGRGAYLFVPPTSSLKGAGQGGADIGANIIYEYVDGQLTNTPLWPWPMEDRIMAEKGISVTHAANGGIWQTLSGVYPSTTITPSPTSTLLPTNTPTL
jgi:hypothetical protein